MVIVYKTVKTGMVMTVRSGWDAKTSTKEEKESIENWGNKFEDEIYKFCSILNVDPDLIDATVDDCMTNVGDPRVAARKLVRNKLRALRLI